MANALVFVVESLAMDNTHARLVEMLGFRSGGFHHSSPGLIISSTLHTHITDIVSSHFCIFQNVYKNHISANLCSTVLNFKMIQTLQDIKRFRTRVL